MEPCVIMFTSEGDLRDINNEAGHPPKGKIYVNYRKKEGRSCSL